MEKVLLKQANKTCSPQYYPLYFTKSRLVNKLSLMGVD